MDVAEALARVTAALPGGGEARPGQVTMAEAVASAVEHHRHVVVQAGTGTGKSLAYLVPLVLSGRHVVVATATKALQDQLARKDLPFLAEHLGEPVTFAVLKGRSNYLCLQRLRELTAAEARLELDGLGRLGQRDIGRLAAWAAETETGDQADLTWSPSPAAWDAVSVSAEQCPGAARCPLGEPCFAEAAKKRATAAQVVVVNTHLYGMHLASGGVVLPEHDVLVVDEAHQLEDIVSDTSGLELSAGRFGALARQVGAVLSAPGLTAGLVDAGTALTDVLAPLTGKRVPLPLPEAITAVLVTARLRLDEVLAALRAVTTEVVDANQRKIRAQKAATTLADALSLAVSLAAGYVAWVAGTTAAPRLELAPLDVADVLRPLVWDEKVAVLTSATIPAGMAERLGLAAADHDALDVGSPFDFEHHALLYCALHLPDPRSPTRPARVHGEIDALVNAAGGRTLALFTSWRALEAAVAELRPRLPYRVLAQGELPKPALVAEFLADETSCLFATSGFFQGIDVPGDALRLVTIDRLPFPRPDDPLLEARREAAGADAFRTVDLPRAATLLAQAAGRLIRTATDRGVVAVLDPRLGTAPYRWDIIRALPPMRRTRHRHEVEAFLRDVAATATRHDRSL